MAKIELPVATGRIYRPGERFTTDHDDEVDAWLQHGYVNRAEGLQDDPQEVGERRSSSRRRGGGFLFCAPASRPRVNETGPGPRPEWRPVPCFRSVADKEPYPEKRSASDFVQPLVKGVAGGVPGVGGVLGEVFGLVWQPALEARRDKWLQALGERVGRLEQVDRERLESEQVLTMVVQATGSAMRTHQSEKHEALRAAVLNSAMAAEPDEEIQLLFLRLIDDYSAAHLQLLKLLDDPVGEFDARGIERPVSAMGSIESIVIEAAFPEWEKAFHERIHADLEADGLAHGISGMMTQRGVWSSRTTLLGKRFLAFITEPK